MQKLPLRSERLKQAFRLKGSHDIILYNIHLGEENFNTMLMGYVYHIVRRRVSSILLSPPTDRFARCQYTNSPVCIEWT
jgi:hypothetical protein